MRGGRIGGLSRLTLRGLPVLAAALVLAGLARVIRSSTLPLETGTAFMGGAYLLALWALWQNRHEPWLPLVLAGVALNALVILANGGRMPVSPRALALAGLSAAPVTDPLYTATGPRTRLAGLGDTIFLGANGRGTIASPGDLAMAVGVAGAVSLAMARRDR